MRAMNLLLVEPNFPLPDKSKNHADFLPIGLLKIGSYHHRLGDKVKIVRGLCRLRRFRPNVIYISSLFTYWSKHVHEAAQFYHKKYPSAKIEIGGIYASLMPRRCKRHSPFATIRRGLYRQGAAEDVPLVFSLLPKLDYQVVHASRGCSRHCPFCGTWRIEPQFECKASILNEIKKPRVVFYDNNLLANPNIDHIFKELAGFRLHGRRRVSCESQSGLDLRHLTHERASLMKQARFENPRIAWDGRYSDWKRVRRAVRILKKVGYGRKEVYVFMLYNHTIPYGEMLKKLDACRRWKVRVADCRFRPLNLTEDNYRPGPKPQKQGEYYVHPGWTDKQVRTFRRKVRQQNIAILLDLPDGRYIQGCEQRRVAT
jgi:hypothetical protein